ncbi:hypothetical protein Cni_G06155 [Canna indica]|uniref:Uncharacterized protein n=1 Tax=Canna indica TaxID=4628 RepID=A0AAQ3Q624_9LILI|nr:hypothetical protein Cni_G06155 [Canna indica]
MEESNAFIACSCALLADSISSLFGLTRCCAVAVVRAGNITEGRHRRDMEGLRAWLVVPLLKAAMVLCLVMSLMVLMENVSVGLISLYAKVFCRRLARIYKCDPVEVGEENGTTAFPMVFVQISMYNEKEVLRLRRDQPEAGHPAGAGHHHIVEGVDNADAEPGHTEVLGEVVDDVDEVLIAAGVVLDDLCDAHEADKCSAVDITRRRSGSPST